MIDFRTDILPLKNQLYRLALRITLDSAEAEDIVQDTLIKVWNKRDDWDHIDNIEAFCLTICRNLSLDSVKRQSHRNISLEDAPTDSPDSNANPSQQSIANDQLAIVRHIVDALPEKQRSCIQLRDFEGKSYKDIATILSMTEEQVKINIFRGRQTIKSRIESLNNYHNTAISS
jgi:RNA polymerase sigma factor (sigma-70 family)